MPRLYQFSMRTIMEAVFVAAVVSAFLYWRNVPQDAPGRYQMLVRGSQELIFVDTSTGKAWESPSSRRGLGTDFHAGRAKGFELGPYPVLPAEVAAQVRW